MHTYAFNENEGGSIVRHGRAFLNSSQWNFGVEWSCFKSSFCHLYIELSINADHPFTFAIALPWLFAFWFHAEHRERTHWLNRIVRWIVPDDYSGERRIGFSIHSWTVYLHPFAKTMEWCKEDPWWERDLSWNVKETVLGSTTYTNENIGGSIPIAVSFDGRLYHGVFQTTRSTWRRPRWFTTAREESVISMHDPIPVPGKGENSWDCVDDALRDIGTPYTDARQAVAYMVQQVHERRFKYGGPNWAPKDP